MEEKQSELRLPRTLHVIAPFYLRPHSHDALRPFRMSTLHFGLVLGWGVFTGNLALSLFSHTVKGAWLRYQDRDKRIQHKRAAHKSPCVGKACDRPELQCCRDFTVELLFPFLPGSSGLSLSFSSPSTSNYLSSALSLTIAYPIVSPKLNVKAEEQSEDPLFIPVMSLFSLANQARGEIVCDANSAMTAQRIGHLIIQ